MRANRLSKAELKEMCEIMSIGNTALRECAVMMGMNARDFRGKLFNDELDTSNLNPEQLAKLEAAKPLIMAVREKCEEPVLANFTRLIAEQSWLAARNTADATNAREEFMQEGALAVLHGIYGYTDTKIQLSTYMWQAIRHSIFDTVNHLNPLCPLTNEALDLVRRVQEIKSKDSDISDERAVEILGFTSSESEVFFRATTRVMNEDWNADTTVVGLPGSAKNHADDYTAKRKSVDRDFKEVFFVRKEARQAIKDADLNEFELACVFGEIFPYHGWKEDVASKHINPRTGERFTRQNVQYTLERAINKIRQAFLTPPDVHLENPEVDKFFDEWDAERAVQKDLESRGKSEQ